MLDSEIEIGRHYECRIGHHLTIVRIEPPGLFQWTGWTATNYRTGRQIEIKSASRLRRRATAAEIRLYERVRPILSARAQRKIQRRKAMRARRKLEEKYTRREIERQERDARRDRQHTRIEQALAEAKERTKDNDYGDE